MIVQLKNKINSDSIKKANITVKRNPMKNPIYTVPIYIVGKFPRISI